VLSQSRSDLLVAEGAQERAMTSLKARLGMPQSVALTTSSDVEPDVNVPQLSVFLERAGTSPDVRRAEAEVRQAEADLRLARSLTWPNLALRAEQSTEEESHILLGGVRISLPLFNRGQGERATAAARLRRAQLELDIARQNAIADASGIYAQYLRQRAAADELRVHAIPLLADNLRLVERSYEVGEIDLSEVLAIRRETLDARTRHLDRRREAAETAIDLESRAGLLLP
jgi:cobalt-zinc-cadmium efflux system outer membrane protein